MNALLFAIIAACCASLSNLFFRKCSSTNAAAYQFLFYYYLSSFAGSFLIRPDLILTSWNPTILGIGCIAGLLNVIMMIVTSRALQHTSAGITFTFQNASSVFPNPVLFLLLGSSFGFMVTGYQMAGMFLILIGLFAGMLQRNQEKKKSTKWIRYALGCLMTQTLILCIFQTRFLAFADGVVDDSDVWFMVGFFGMALIFQSFILYRQKRQLQVAIVPSIEHQEIAEFPPMATGLSAKTKILYGGLSGVANAISTYFLLQATQLASPLESGLIFPLFAVAVMVLCNIWGYWLYQEQPKTATLVLCSFGIFVASLG